MIRFHDYGYGLFNAARRIGPALWDRFDLLWIHRGRVGLRLTDQEPIELAAGEGVLIYPHTAFDGDSLVSESFASVQHFALAGSPTRLLEPYRRLAGLSRGYRRYAAHHPELIDRSVDVAINLAFRPQTPLVHDMRVAQLAVILGMLEQWAMETPSEAALGDSIRHLNQWLGSRLNEPVSLEEMARQMNLSVSHFRARFREQTGQSPGRHFLELRMQEAARLLRESALPVKTISQQMGYSDLPNFYRTFRGVLGMSPAAYRSRFAPRG